MNMMLKRAAYFAALVLLVSSGGCSMDDIAGVAEGTPLCTRTILEDLNGGREVVCAEEFIDDAVEEDGDGDD